MSSDFPAIGYGGPNHSLVTSSGAADDAGNVARFGGIHFESDDLAGRALVADKF